MCCQKEKGAHGCALPRSNHASIATTLTQRNYFKTRAVQSEGSIQNPQPQSLERGMVSAHTE